MDPLDHIVTERLKADRLEERDLENLLVMDRDPRIMKPLGGVRPEDATSEYLRRNLHHWDRHGYGLWMLRLRSDDSFVGRAYLRHLHIANNDEIAVGYALLPEFWGKGLATEIATAIVDLAFTRVGLTSLVSAARPDNHPSCRVLEKIGGRYERDTVYKGSPHKLFRIEMPVG